MIPFLVASIVGNGLTFIVLPVTVAALTAIVHYVGNASW